MPSCRSRINRIAMEKAMMVASAILPIAGRPARITRSERCGPPMMELNPSSPEVMPDKWQGELSARGALSTARNIARGLQEDSVEKEGVGSGVTGGREDL